MDEDELDEADDVEEYIQAEFLIETVRCGGSGRLLDDDDDELLDVDSADEYSDDTTDNLDK